MMLIESPLNYTGRKFKLLNQILPLFPKEIDTFIDLFCGGGDVGINVNCNKVHFNDIDSNIIGILSAFSALDKKEILFIIEELIEKYNLSDVKKYGYSYYNCNSSKGLGDYNKEAYNNFRTDFNSQKNYDYQYYIQLYTLIIFSFNNQIRFNKKGEFNLPVGKRDFNMRMKTKLDKFIDKIKSKPHNFSSIDFRETDTSKITEKDFVYVDPPYLITCAPYNEQGKWNEDKERSLYEYLDELNERNIRFALSNVLQSKGKNNEVLLKWLSSNLQYHCFHLKYNYSNCNYQTKDKVNGSDEILVTNYL